MAIHRTKAKAKTNSEKPLVVFFAPRYHTNQNGWVRALLDDGRRVQFWVFYNPPDYVKPLCETLKLAPSIMSWPRLVVRRLLEPMAPPEDVSRATFMPLVIQIIFLLVTRRPELLILRDRTRPSLVTALLARVTGVSRVMFYDQFPADDPTANRAGASPVGLWLQRRLGLLSIPSITPIPPEKFYTKPHGERPPLPSGRFFVPFVVNAAEPRPPESYCPDGILRILVVGKYRPYKGLELVPQALQLLETEQRQSLDVTFAGQESTSAELTCRSFLESRLSEIGELRSFRVLSNIPHDQMVELYSNADCAILPSTHDLAAIAPLEAMAHWVVPIVTKGNGTTRYIRNAATGFIIDPLLPDTLSSIIKRLFAEAELTETMARTGASFAHYELSAGKFKDFSAKLLSKNGLKNLGEPH